MSTIAEHHTAIKAALDTVPGLRAHDSPPQSAQFPMAYPTLDEWEPTTFARTGHKRYTYSVYVFTSETVRPQDGYDLLMEYADHGSKSIDLAIWDLNDRSAGTFNSLASTSAQVLGFRVLGAEEVDAFGAYGGVFTVEIRTKKV